MNVQIAIINKLAEMGMKMKRTRIMRINLWVIESILGVY